MSGSPAVGRAPRSGGGSGIGFGAFLAAAVLGHGLAVGVLLLCLGWRGAGLDASGAAFLAVVVGVALLAALQPIRAAAAELRRVLRGLEGFLQAEASGASALAPEARLAGGADPTVDSDDEIGLLAWTWAVRRRALDEELRRCRRARQALGRADQDKVDFVALMSHELRTPLNSILGFSEVLLEGMEGPLNPGQREDLRIVRESGDHLLALVNDILDMSALRSGQLRLSPVDLDLAALCRRILDEAEGVLRGRRVRLVGEFESEPFRMRADERLLWRVIQNLVSNALKFTQEGEVRIRLVREGPDVVLEVRDTGAGIPADALAIIFEEYRQAGDQRTKREGTGLGLAIARRLVEMHGGTLTATSEVGKGSVFRLVIPAAGPAAAPAAGPAAGEAVAGG